MPGMRTCPGAVPCRQETIVPFLAAWAANLAREEAVEADVRDNGMSTAKKGCHGRRRLTADLLKERTIAAKKRFVKRSKTRPPEA